MTNLIDKNLAAFTPRPKTKPVRFAQRTNWPAAIAFGALLITSFAGTFLLAWLIVIEPLVPVVADWLTR